MVLRVPIIGTPLGDNFNFLNDTIQLAYDISTFGGNDTVTGANLSDIIRGGDGNDILNGAGGDDFLFGGNDGDILRGGTGNDSLSGEAGNDLMFGESGNDSMNGGSGNDLMVGGSGRDVMTGSTGLDTFRFDFTTDSVRGASRDIITDFVQGQDIISLENIDVSGLTGDQDFAFIGSAAFTGGDQLRAFNTFTADGRGITVVQGDMNGDRIADIEIQLTGNYLLTANDFDL
jgi:Ca2+-binding RTX toxin-like protein